MSLGLEMSLGYKNTFFIIHITIQSLKVFKRILAY